MDVNDSAMSLVTTHTHVNYKLLVLYRVCYRVYTEITNNKLYVKWILYRVCYRVYTEITNNKLYVKWTTLLASSTITLQSTICLNESRYVDTE